MQQNLHAVKYTGEGSRPVKRPNRLERVSDVDVPEPNAPMNDLTEGDSGWAWIHWRNRTALWRAATPQSVPL